MTNLRPSRPHPRGPRGNSSGQGRGRGRGSGRICSSRSPGGRAPRPGAWRGENPGRCSPTPTGAAPSAPPRSPLNGARPPPGPLTDSAAAQATKPKVSRIQARRMFPGDALGAAARQEASCPAPGAAREEGSGAGRPRRSRLGLGLGLGGSGSGLGAARRLLLRLLPGPRLRPGNAAPSHLLVSALRPPSGRSGEAAPWTSPCSAAVLLLPGSPSASRLRFPSRGVNWTPWNAAAAEVRGQSGGGALRAAGARGESGEERGAARLVARRLRPSSSRAAPRVLLPASPRAPPPPPSSLRPSLPPEPAAAGSWGDSPLSPERSCGTPPGWAAPGPARAGGSPAAGPQRPRLPRAPSLPSPRVLAPSPSPAPLAALGRVLFAFIFLEKDRWSSERRL